MNTSSFKNVKFDGSQASINQSTGEIYVTAEVVAAALGLDVKLVQDYAEANAITMFEVKDMYDVIVKYAPEQMESMVKSMITIFFNKVAGRILEI